MTKPPTSQQRVSARERLRWQRAMDERLIDAIFGVVRDVPLPSPAALSVGTINAGPITRR